MVTAVIYDRLRNEGSRLVWRARPACGDSQDNVQPERGQVLVIVALVLGVLIALVGLAVDGAVVYAKHSRLQAVADAAALAAAEALVAEDRVPTTDLAAESHQKAARRAAELYVRLNDLAAAVEVSVAPAPGGSRVAPSVTVTLSQVIPLHFLSIIDVDAVPVSASATASRSSVVADLILALDSSKCNRGKNAWLCSEIREGAWTLAQEVLAQGGRVGVVDYRRTARVLVSPTSEPEKVWQALSQWGRGFARTKDRNLGDAIWLAAQVPTELPGERPRGVLLLATGDATTGRKCCVECKCALDGLARCGKRCSYERCCARWAREMAFSAWQQGVFVLALDGTGTKRGNKLMQDVADLGDDGRLNGTRDYYILVGDRPGKKPRRGDFAAAFARVPQQLPGGRGVQLVR